jgi:hypothetical protein
MTLAVDVECLVSYEYEYEALGDRIPTSMGIFGWKTNFSIHSTGGRKVCVVILSLHPMVIMRTAEATRYKDENEDSNISDHHMISCFPTRSLLTFILGRRVSIDQGSTPWTEILSSMAGVKTDGATTQVLKLAQSKTMMMLLL